MSDEWQDFSTSSPLERLSAKVESQLRSWGCPLKRAKQRRKAGAGVGLHDSPVSLQVASIQVAGLAVDLVCCEFPTAARRKQGVDQFSVENDCWLPELDDQTEEEAIRRMFGLDRFVLLRPAASSASSSRLLASISSSSSSTANPVAAATAAGSNVPPGGATPQKHAAADGHQSLASRAVTLLSACTMACDACSCDWACLVPVAEPWRRSYIGYQARSRRTVLRFESASSGHAPPSLRQTSDLVALHFRRHDPSLSTVAPRSSSSKTPGSSPSSHGPGLNRLHVRTTFDVETESAADPVAFVRVTGVWPCVSVRDGTSLESLASSLADDAFPVVDAPHWTVRPVYADEPSLPLVETLTELGQSLGRAQSVLSVNALINVVRRVPGSIGQVDSSSAAPDNTASLSRRKQLMDATVRGGMAVAARAAAGVSKAAAEVSKAANTVPAVSGLVSAGVGTAMDVAGIDRARVDASVVNGLVHAVLSSDLLAPAEEASDAPERRSFYESIGCIRGAKGAPPGSLLATLVLRALPLVRGSLVSWAMVWKAFVGQIRKHWEQRRRLGKSLTPGRPPARMSVDFGSCLVHQKLQMIDYCVAVQQQLERRANAGGPAAAEPMVVEPVQVVSSRLNVDVVDATTDGDGWGDDDADGLLDELDLGDSGSENDTVPGSNGEGRAERLKGLFLLHDPEQPMYLPHLQDAGPFTEDMAKERETVLLSMAEDSTGGGGGDSLEFQSAVLRTDMSAFKAANPGAVLEDFVRWHSPRDWVDGQLSSRMTGPDNVWRVAWDAAASQSAEKQKPLFKAEVEANKALHYLDTVMPHELVVQIMLTIVRCLPYSLVSSVGGLIHWNKMKLDSDGVIVPSSSSRPLSIIECVKQIGMPVIGMKSVLEAVNVSSKEAELRTGLSIINGDGFDTVTTEQEVNGVSLITESIAGCELMYRRGLSLCLALGARTNNDSSWLRSAEHVLSAGRLEVDQKSPIRSSLNYGMLERWNEVVIDRNSNQRTYCCKNDYTFQVATVQVLSDAWI